MVLQSQEEQRIDGRGDNGVPSSHDSGHGGGHADRQARRDRDCRYVRLYDLSVSSCHFLSMSRIDCARESHT